jgi:hypothetical protein
MVHFLHPRVHCTYTVGHSPAQLKGRPIRSNPVNSSLNCLPFGLAIVNIRLVWRKRPAASRVDEVIVMLAIESCTNDHAVDPSFLNDTGPKP